MWQRLSDKQKLFAAGGVALVVVMLLSVWVMARGEDGPQEMERAILTLAETDSLQARAQLNVFLPQKIANRERRLQEAEIVVVGDVKRGENGMLNMSGRLDMEARGRGNIFFVEGEQRIFDDQVAFRLETLPSILNPSGSLLEKWTYVDASLLKTNNPEAVREVLLEAAQQFTREGRAELNDETGVKYIAQLDEGQRQRMREVFNYEVSGNQGLHLVSRLIETYDLNRVEAVVSNDGRELIQLKSVFTEQTSEGEVIERAVLDLAFSEYGKAVVIEEPPVELTVRAQVFAKLFGTGTVEQVD